MLCPYLGILGSIEMNVTGLCYRTMFTDIARCSHHIIKGKRMVMVKEKKFLSLCVCACM